MKMSVGIFFWDNNTDIKSLIDQLLDIAGPCSIIPVLPDNESEWRCVERSSPVIIIFPSQTSAAPGSSLRRFLDLCLRTHEPEDVIMVITDLEDTKSEKRTKAEWRGQYGWCPLLTLTEAEMKVISISDRTNVSVDRRMARKIRNMMEILQGGNPFQRLWALVRKPVIGIFSRDAEVQYSWLVDALRSDISRDYMVRTCYISNGGFQQFSEDVSHCTYGILYHTKNRGRINVTDITASLYDEELQHLSSRLGKKKLIVVIDDLEDSGEEQKTKILDSRPSIREKAKDLFLFSQEEKTSNYQRRLRVEIEEPEKKLQRLRNIIRTRKTANAQKAEKSKGKMSTGHVSSGSIGISLNFRKKSIGIFSRCSETEYSWLEKLLKSEISRDYIPEVRTCYISNGGFQQFSEDVSSCTYGILYHTKNRGRINVTDVTDSLYDEELQHLSSRLGKKNVVVVIDDLEDSSNTMKERICTAQPSIPKLAQHLILVESASSEEKMREVKEELKKVLQ